MKILYYWRKALFSILVFVIIIAISTLITGNLKIDFNSIDDIIYLILGISIFLGTFYYIYHKYFAPKIRLEQLEEYPFTEFKRIGFESNKDCLIGKLNKYTVIVGYSWEYNDKIQTVYAMIIFDPRINGKNLNDYNLWKWQQSIKDKFNFWNYGSLTTIFPFQFEKPKFEKIILKLEKNIKIIENKGLKKIEFNEWKNEIESFTEKDN